jgi:hypothetical protein
MIKKLLSGAITILMKWEKSVYINLILFLLMYLPIWKIIQNIPKKKKDKKENKE